MLGETGGEVTLIGNLIALMVPISISILFIVITKMDIADAWLIFAAAQGLGCAFVFLFFDVSVPPTAFDAFLIGVNGLIVGSLAMGLITLGLRMLPAAEVSLLMTGETIIGPILVWWWVGLMPGFYTLIGGALVLLALFGNAFWRLRNQNQTSSA